MKRRIYVLLFLFSLAAPFAGSYLWLQHQKAQIKKQVKWDLISGMDKADLVLFGFSLTELETLRWEHDREFEYLGEMYDVVAVEKDGDTNWYWVWWDHKETRLNQHLEKLVTQAWAGDPLQKKNKDRLISFVKNLYCTPAISFNPLMPASIKNIPPPYLNLYSSVLAIHNSPPPWLS